MEPTGTTAPTSSTPSTPSEESHAHVALVYDVIVGHLASAAIRTAASLRVADHLADGPLAIEELARRTDTDALSLRRVLRFLAARGIFHESEPGSYALTPPAELLRSDVPGSLRDGALLLAHELFRKPSADLEETVRTGRPAFDRVFGMPFFTYLQEHPDLSDLFDAGMESFAGAMDDAVADVYEFPASGTIVDVGGGRGGLLRTILLRNPGLSGVLFDQQSTVDQHILDHPELAGRWRVEGGDFFSAVPAGGDIYVIKHTLHNWDDEHCLRILRACRAAMEPGKRLLVVDAIIPPGDDPAPGKNVDVTMLTVLTGRERTAEEFEGLFRDSGFEFVRSLPTATWTSVTEAIAK
ncbi:methyltransferase [Streptomyces sp. NPDC003077]|uniref:methyltransferase n=1 Tax=Streptomyces sp. NPDC003077 TaxID=3154443 RepID=UPI0033AB2F2A